jgi:hypothetical protein
MVEPVRGLGVSANTLFYRGKIVTFFSPNPRVLYAIEQSLLFCRPFVCCLYAEGLPVIPAAEKLLMSSEIDMRVSGQPISTTLQTIFTQIADQRTADDLLFLERWELAPVPGSAAAMRVGQIRRANPELATAIRLELAPNGKPKAHRGGFHDH